MGEDDDNKTDTHNDTVLTYVPQGQLTDRGGTFRGKRVGAIVGHGAFSVVFLTELGVIKIGFGPETRQLHLQLLGKPLTQEYASTCRRSFRGDTFARKLLRLLQRNQQPAHPNLLFYLGQVGEPCEEDATPFILVRRQCKAMPLDKWLKKNPGKLSGDQVLDILLSVASVVDFLHGTVRLLHLDIKESNLLYDPSAAPGHRITLIDFSLAMALGEERDDAALPNRELMGDEHYIAPERVDGLPSPTWDRFALGSLAFRLFTGFALPYKFPSLPNSEGIADQLRMYGQTLSAHDGVATPLPKAAVEAVVSCTSRDPRARAGRASRWAKKLQGCFRSPSWLPSGVEVDIQRDWQPSTLLTRRNKRLVWAGAVALGGVAVFAASRLHTAPTVDETSARTVRPALTEGSQHPATIAPQHESSTDAQVPIYDARSLSLATGTPQLTALGTTDAMRNTTGPIVPMAPPTARPNFPVKPKQKSNRSTSPRKTRRKRAAPTVQLPSPSVALPAKPKLNTAPLPPNKNLQLDPSLRILRPSERKVSP